MLDVSLCLSLRRERAMLRELDEEMTVLLWMEAGQQRAGQECVSDLGKHLATRCHRPMRARENSPCVS